MLLHPLLLSHPNRRIFVLHLRKKEIKEESFSYFLFVYEPNKKLFLSPRSSDDSMIEFELNERRINDGEIKLILNDRIF